MPGRSKLRPYAHMHMQARRGRSAGCPRRGGARLRPSAMSTLTPGRSKLRPYAHRQAHGRGVPPPAQPARTQQVASAKRCHQGQRHGTMCKIGVSVKNLEEISPSCPACCARLSEEQAHAFFAFRMTISKQNRPNCQIKIVHIAKLKQSDLPSCMLFLP